METAVPKPENPNALLRPEQVAEMLQCSVAWVRDHATRRSPRLPVVKLGTARKPMLRFRRKDVEAFIELHYVDDSQRRM